MSQPSNSHFPMDHFVCKFQISYASVLRNSKKKIGLQSISSKIYIRLNKKKKNSRNSSFYLILWLTPSASGSNFLIQHIHFMYKISPAKHFHRRGQSYYLHQEELTDLTLYHKHIKKSLMGKFLDL